MTGRIDVDFGDEVRVSRGSADYDGDVHWRIGSLCLLVAVLPAISIAQDAPRRAKVGQQEERASIPGGATSSLPVPLEIPKVTHPLPELLKALDNVDPLVQDRAREELMLLRRDDLKMLQTAAKNAGPLTSLQLSALSEIVTHVYLTETHRFEGRGSGLIGITSPRDLSVSVVVAGRKIGYDGYRVLRDGDTVVGLQAQRGPGFGDMKAIENFEGLREVMVTTHAGDWLNIRVIRNGEPLEVMARLGSNETDGVVVAGVSPNDNPFLSDAQNYWERTFLPGLATAAASQPVSQ